MCYKESPQDEAEMNPSLSKRPVLTPRSSTAHGRLPELDSELPPPPPPPKMVATKAPGHSGVVKVVEESNAGASTQVPSEKNSGVFALKSRESHNDRSMSGGLTPTTRRFGNSAGGRMLSQLYSGAGSCRNSREIDLKNVDKSDLANGPNHEGLRVQHFLRTSQVHSVKQKPLSGRSDSSSDVGRRNSCRA